MRTFTGPHRLYQQPTQRRPGSFGSPSSPGLTVIFIAVPGEGRTYLPSPFFFKHTRRRLVPVVAGRRPRWYGVRFPTAETFQATFFALWFGFPIKGYDPMLKTVLQEVLEERIPVVTDELETVYCEVDWMPTEEQAARTIATWRKLFHLCKLAALVGMKGSREAILAMNLVEDELAPVLVQSGIHPLSALVLLEAQL